VPDPRNSPAAGTPAGGGLLRDVGVLTLAQIAAQLLNVVALVYIARMVGDHWFGVIQLGSTFSMYALIAAEWGMFSLGVRSVARLTDPGRLRSYVRCQVGLMHLLALAVFALGLAVLPLFPFYAEDRWVFILFLASVFPQAWMLQWVGIGLERMTWVGVAKTVRSLVYAGLVLLLLGGAGSWSSWPVHRWVPVFVLIAFVAGDLVMAGPVFRWLGGPFLPRPGRLPETGGMLRETSAIGGGNLVRRVLLHIDIIMLGMLSSPAMAGSYAAAAKLVFVLVMVVELILTAMLPRLSRLWMADRAGFSRQYSIWMGTLIVVLLPVALGGALIGDPLIVLIYGDRFAGAGTVFSILSVSYVLLCMGMFCGNGLIACDRQRAYLPPLVFSAVVAVAGNILLVPRWGMTGSALAMLAAHASLMVVTLWSGRGYMVAGELRRPLAAAFAGCVLMVLTVLWLDSAHVVWRVVAGAAVYVVCVLSVWRPRSSSA